MALYTYSPEQISVVVAGRNIEGFSEDSIVTVSRNADTWTPSVGADGDTTRSYNPDRSGTIEITLKQSSPDNLFLSGLDVAGTLSLLGTFPVLVKDNNGQSLYTAAAAWIQKPADGEFAREAGDRVWTIYAAEIIMVAGGSN